MIDHVWTVVCSRAIIDQDSNNVSLENVIEQLKITAEPIPDGLLPIPLQVMTLWARSDFDIPARGRGRLAFLSPSGIVSGPVEFEIDLSGEFTRHRTRGNFQALPLPEPGRYTFRVDLWREDQKEWLQVAAVPLQVIFEPPEGERAQMEAP